MFFKKGIENAKFNNMLIAATADTTKKSGRLPTESELMATIEGLARTNNGKLTGEQVNKIRLSAVVYQMGAGDEMLPVFKHLTF